MDDDDDVNNDVYTKILLRRRWRIRFFRGWLILDISGFPHSKPDSAASIKPRRNY